jgi:hypothetical protein
MKNIIELCCKIHEKNIGHYGFVTKELMSSKQFGAKFMV